MSFIFQSTSVGKMLIFLATFFAIVGFVSASPTLALSADDVILHDGNGKMQIMKASEFDALQARDLAARVPAAESSIMSVVERALPTGNVARGGCEQSTEVQVLSDKTALGADVAISPVTSAQGLTIAQVAVTKGYSIANQLTVESSASGTFDKVLEVSLSVSYSETWTTSDSTTLTYNVPAGKFGVIVSEPYTREVKGNVLSGCTDNPTSTPFTSDTYTTETYSGMSWVKGVLRLCTSDSYPIPFCIGKGSHT